MGSWHKIGFVAIALWALAGSVALANPGGVPNWGNSGKSIKGVPVPIAGAGLPFLLLAGGALVLRRYRKRNRAG
jgi:LPXTG-motif cell wall-anchored protein